MVCSRQRDLETKTDPDGSVFVYLHIDNQGQTEVGTFFSEPE